MMQSLTESKGAGRGLGALVLLSTLAACGHKSSSPAVIPAPDGSANVVVASPTPVPAAPTGTALITGKINGAAWTFVSGSGNTQSDGTVMLSLYSTPSVDSSGKAVDPCDYIPTSANDSFLLLSVQKKLGTYNGGTDTTSQEVTFVYPDGKGSSMNNVASDGQLVVTAVTSTQIQGELNFTADANNQAQGAFTASICP